MLHRREILRLENGVAAKGYTVMSVELYFIGGRVEVETALARGKQEQDERQTIREREDNREAQRAPRDASHRRGQCSLLRLVS